VLQHDFAERGELHRKGGAAEKARTEALEGVGEHVFGKVRTGADGRARILQESLQAASGRE